MGWWFQQGAEKKDIIKDLIREQENENGKWTTIAHSVRGNILWSVREVLHKKENKTERYILCSILGKEKNYGWGSKDMDEGMGPCYYSCPLKYLDMAPEPNSEHSKAWRETVRAYHKKMNFKFAIGMKVELEYCKIPYVEITSVKPLRGTHDGVLYRLHRRSIKGVWVENQLSLPLTV